MRATGADNFQTGGGGFFLFSDVDVNFECKMDMNVKILT